MNTCPATLETADGVTLEARWDVPAEPRGVAVLCHPHPQYGGTMHVPLWRTVASCLAGSGTAVLRFNFRGVGASSGKWTGGRGEVTDLAAAAAAAGVAFPGLPLGLAGWSFGALVALAWQGQTGSGHRLVAIAPPTRVEVGPRLPDPAVMAPAPRLFIVGSRDQFADPERLAEYAQALHAELIVIPGSDHFFYAREHYLGEMVATHLSPAVAPDGPP